MKKIICFVLAIAMMATLFCGCEGYYDPNFEPPVTNTPVETTVATQPETQPAPTETTVPTIHEAENTAYKVEEEVWFVTRDEYDDTWVYPGSIVAIFDEYAIVTRSGIDSINMAHFEEIMSEPLNHSEECAFWCGMHLVSIDDCYRTSEEAWGAAGKVPLEDLPH